MKTAQLLALAWRESRTARRRLLLYMSSILLGVAALVAIDSFADNVTNSVREQSQALLGGDIAISSRAEYPPAVRSFIDSLERTGTRTARQTTFASMALVPRTDRTRLIQVRAVSELHPFYGEVTTKPAGIWRELQQGRHALVDPSILLSLGATVGDTLALGEARFVIAGTIANVPGDAGVSAAIGPRVYIAERWLEETGLLVFGSRAEYETLLRLAGDVTPLQFDRRYSKAMRDQRVRLRTAADTEENLTESIAQLRDFLGIVGFVALLLGGIGVASGVHAYVMRKVETVAILRCLGASSAQVMAIYVLQALAMGLVGAAVGAALGIAIQLALPAVMQEFLPVDVRVRIAPAAVALGLAIGGWVALIFSLSPLVALRRISPLQALRREADADVMRRARRDPARWLVALAIVGSLVLLGISRAGSVLQGLWFSAAIAAAVLVLWGAAALLARVARLLLRPKWSFSIRQGVANLYRPGNQTRAVALALGFGVFLMSTLYQVQSNLLRTFDAKLDASRANVVLFDIQDAQQQPLDSLVRAGGHQIVQQAPIVPMRIESINGIGVSRLLADTSAGRRRSGWALRREYRSTYRDTMVASEVLTRGSWFGRGAGAAAADTIPEASFEQELATELRLELGDVVTWNVQGVAVPTRVTSFREVEWARFEPNFFVVTEREALEAAPKQWVVMAQAPGDTGVARLQRDVLGLFPNVSSLDLSLVQRTVEQVLGKVTTAIRFLAWLSLGLGVPVLFSAVSATRRERMREGVLLKTLGATRRQIGRIMVAEYALLGLLGSAVGVLLSMAGAWALVRFVFDGEFRPALLPALAVAMLMSALAIGIGLLTSREVFASTPMTALRES